MQPAHVIAGLDGHHQAGLTLVGISGEPVTNQPGADRAGEDLTIAVVSGAGRNGDFVPAQRAQRGMVARPASQRRAASLYGRAGPEK